MAKKTTKSRKQPAKTAAKQMRRKPTLTRSATRRAAATVARKARGAALVSVAPSFTANDARASIKWYCDVLGFKVIERWEHQGQFMGAQIGLDTVVFNIGQDDWKLGRDRVKGQGTRMFITTGPDVDAYASAIKSRGGVLASEPVNEWGMRAFSVNDPDGFKLTFMTKLPK